MTLQDAIETVKRELCATLDQLGPHDFADKGWHDRRRTAMTALADPLAAEPLAARISDNWNGAKVRIAGVQATSTSGLQGALQNWVAAAERKAAS